MTTDTDLPLPPSLPQLTWRPATMDDVASVYQLILDIDAHDDRHWAETLADLENEFRDPDMDLERDTLVGFASDGRAVALGWVYAPHEAENKHRAFLFPDLHPDFRQPALEDFLAAWCEARARQILNERSNDRPKILRAMAGVKDARRIAWFERHDFAPIRYFFEMRRDLALPIAKPDLPPGLSFVQWTPERDQAAFEAFNEAFRDHWGFEPMSKTTWDLYIVGRSSFCPELSYLVLDGDEVAGFSLNFISPEENERKGIEEGWVGDLGVRRPWRKQGLATALLNQSMRAFRAAGLNYASLGVDTENPTGALRVYERVGFTPVKRSMSLAKDVGVATEQQTAAFVIA